MKIGIGCTTYNRPECLAKWKQQIAKHTFMDNVLIYIAEDTDHDRQGVAKRKNECLRALKDCDHIFLFDDDCYPIKDGWVERFVNSGYPHLLFLDESKHRKYDDNESRQVFYDCGGVFMYMTKKMVECVGAFDENYIMYGFEHADYSNRIFGIHSYYVMLPDTNQYLYAEDYSNPKHKSSITDKDKLFCIEANKHRYFKLPKQTYIPL